MVDTGSDNILKAKLSLLKGLFFTKLFTLQWLSFQGKGTTFCFKESAWWPGGHLPRGSRGSGEGSAHNPDD